VIFNWILAFATSALLVFLFPRFSFVWLAPIAITPLLIACAREERRIWRFILGYAAGAAYWFGLCNWIQWTLARHAGVGNGVAWILFTMFCLAKALQMGLFALLAGPLMKRQWTLPGVAALWVLVEWTHSWTGFEWLNLGNAGSDMSVPLRLAPFTGVWGLSFVFALIATVIAIILLRRQRLASLWLLILPGMLFLPDVPAPERGDTGAVLVQPNIDDETIWSDNLVRETEERLAALSLTPLLGREHPVDLIVWPEMPAPFYENDPAFIANASRVAQTAHAGVLSGVVGRAVDGGVLNSAILISAQGAVVSRYDKVNLVPFGEFVPWPFGMITKKVSTEAGDFEPGSRIVVSQLGSHAIGAFICYESVFPSYIRRFVAEGAEALFNISNDSWFGTSQARYQHLLIVRMRAAENRRWILRATDNGVTGVIDPAGRLLRTVPEYREVTARVQYRYRKDQTFYTKFGDWFVLLCALITTVSLAATLLPSYRPSRR
jgi:apolipoprotein N-acyltransferase